jgi:ethanolamine utilization protein EutJ
MDAETVNNYIRLVERSGEEVLGAPGERIKVGVDLGTAYIVIVVLDENDNPVACEKRAADVLRDGVVVDYLGARDIVSELKTALESRMGRQLRKCAIAMPPGTHSSTKTHVYVAEGAGFDVVRVLDEPSAANSVLRISDGVIVDLGGGTTGLAVFRDGEVVYTADEATGGTHMSLALAGNSRISYEEAEKIKTDYTRHGELFPIVRPVMEKMATIVKSYIGPYDPGVVYLCGGTSCFTKIEEVFEAELGIPVVKPENPLLVTPAGIAMNCIP